VRLGAQGGTEIRHRGKKRPWKKEGVCGETSGGGGRSSWMNHYLKKKWRLIDLSLDPWRYSREKLQGGKNQMKGKSEKRL